MSCIKPIAPRGEIACSSPPLSTCITARIQGAGTAKRPDAESINLAKRSTASERVAVCARALESKTVEAVIWHRNSATATLTRAIVRRERRLAIGSSVVPIQCVNWRPHECFPIFGPGR